MKLLFLFRSQCHHHPLAFELRKLLHLAELFQLLRKTQQQDFALLLKHNRTAAEHYIRTHLATFFEKLHGVIFLEVKIVVIRMRTKTNLLYNNFRRFGFQFLLFLFLIVQELLVINNAANRRLGIRCNFYQVETGFFRNFKRFFEREYALLNVFTYYTYLCRTDFLIDLVRIFLFRRTETAGREGRTRTVKTTGAACTSGSAGCTVVVTVVVVRVDNSSAFMF